jgi:hypothetical protein
MKFFTMKWWSGEAEHDANEEYQAHWRNLTRIPPALRRLEEDVGLHDAHLLRMENGLRGELLLILSRLDGQGRRSPLTLKYLDVASMVITSDPGVGLSGPHGFGDLGYDEIDIGADGLAEHRILFSSGIEISVRFRDLVLEGA